MIPPARAGGSPARLIMPNRTHTPMLDVLRRGASTWISKLLLSLLIVSFGVWGIADVFRGFGSNTAYKIGKTEIGVAELDNAYGRELRQMSQRAGRPVNKDEALRSGLSQQILSRIVTDTTFREAADSLRLGISDAAIAADIVADASFKGTNGAFDRNRFVDLLRTNGMNEAYYVTQRRADLVRGQLLEGVSGGVSTPQAWLEAVHHFRNEARTIRYATISASTIGTIAEPSEADLATFYEARKVAFRAAETRNLAVLKLDAAAVAKPGDVTEDDAKAEYERQKARFGTMEKRRVRQISFEDTAQAEAALAEIAAGKSFVEIATARGLEEKDIDLGLMAKTGFIDPKVADAAFALPAVGARSGVVAGRVRPVLLELAELVPGTQKTYADVSADLKLEIAKKRAEADVLTLHDQIEDALAGGTKIADVATRFHMVAQVIDHLSRDGTVADGSKPSLPLLDKLVNEAFESDVGVENDPLDLGGHGFMWYAVTAIAPAHDRPLTEVKDRVLAAWKAEETAKRLAETAKAVTDRLAKGEAFDAAIEASGLKVETSADFKRADKPEGFSPAMIAAAFAGPEGHVASVAGPGDSRVVLQVASITPPVYFPGTDEEKELGQAISASLRRGLLEDWVRAVQKDIGVSVNQQVVARVTGRAKD